MNSSTGIFVAASTKKIQVARTATLCRWTTLALRNFDVTNTGVNEVTSLKAFRTGTSIVTLAEALFKRKSTEVLMDAAGNRNECLQNVHRALLFLKSLGLPVSFHEAEIVDVKADVVLDLLWMMVRRHYLHTMLGSTMYTDAAMYDYVLQKSRDCVVDYDEISIDDLSLSFQNGLAFCAIVCYYDWRLLNYNQCIRFTDRKRMNLAFEKAERGLGVPRLLSPDHALEGDSVSIATYLAAVFVMAEERVQNTQEHLSALTSEMSAYALSVTRLTADKDEQANELGDMHAYIAQQTEEVMTLKQLVLEKDEALQQLNDAHVELQQEQASTRADFQRARAVYERDIVHLKGEVVQLQSDNRDLASRFKTAHRDGGAASFQLKTLMRVGDNTTDEDMANTAALEKITPPSGYCYLMFTDVAHSTILWENDPEMMSDALFTHNKIVRRNLAANQGYEVKTEGDAFMVAFQTPKDAVTAALNIQRDLMDAAWSDSLLTREHAKEVRENGKLIFRGLRVRVGLHCGIPSVVPDPLTKRSDYFGPVVNLAARIAGSASGGQTVVSSTVWESAQDYMENVCGVDLGLHLFKGISFDVPITQISTPELSTRTFPPLGASKALPVSKSGTTLPMGSLMELETNQEQVAQGSRLDLVIRHLIGEEKGKDPAAALEEMLHQRDEAVGSLDALTRKVAGLEKDNMELTAYIEKMQQQRKEGREKDPEVQAPNVAAYLNHLGVSAEYKDQLEKMKGTHKDLKTSYKNLEKENDQLRRQNRVLTNGTRNIAELQRRNARRRPSKTLDIHQLDRGNVSERRSLALSDSNLMVRSRSRRPKRVERMSDKRGDLDLPHLAEDVVDAEKRMSTISTSEEGSNSPPPNRRMLRTMTVGSLQLPEISHSNQKGPPSLPAKQKLRRKGNGRSMSLSPMALEVSERRYSSEEVHLTKRRSFGDEFQSDEEDNPALAAVFSDVIAFAFIELATEQYPDNQETNRITNESHPAHAKLADTLESVERASARLEQMCPSVEMYRMCVDHALRDYSWAITTSEGSCILEHVVAQRVARDVSLSHSTESPPRRAKRGGRISSGEMN